MRVLKGIAAAFSTYSVLPMPRVPWDADSARYALCAFPLVGIVIGLALFAWRLLPLPPAVFAAGAVVLPLLVTGGIHMDGFCDTLDALCSHQSREQKLAIMKDPHMGTFGAIWLGCYLLFSFALFYEASSIIPVCVGYVLSRALSALNALTLPNARGSGMLLSLTENAARRAGLWCAGCTILLCAACMLLLAPRMGLACLLLCGLCTFFYRLFARRVFGGTTGDTAGFFLQICEISILTGAVLCA